MLLQLFFEFVVAQGFIEAVRRVYLPFPEVAKCPSVGQYGIQEIVPRRARVSGSAA